MSKKELLKAKQTIIDRVVDDVLNRGVVSREHLAIIDSALADIQAKEERKKYEENETKHRENMRNILADMWR